MSSALRRWAPLAVLVLVLAAIAVTFLGVGSSGRALDPDNPEPRGTKALARVLSDDGVEVAVQQSLAGLRSTTVDGGTTLVISDPSYLGPTAGEQVLEEATDAARVVVLAPGPDTATTFDLPVSTTSDPRSGPLAARCELPWWRQGDRMTAASTLVEVTEVSADASACVPPRAGYGAGGARGGYVVQLAATSDRPEVVLVGIAQALTNAHITEEANAAVALRLLGETDRLVWYVPGPADDLGERPASLLDVLPAAVPPALVIGLAALLTLALWRGRRLGPVVTEPLPVVVPSLETTEHRSHLYRSAGDRERALATLQAGTRRRLASRLGLPPTVAAEQVVMEVARVSGRHTDEVRRTLTDPSAPDDETLVRTARAARALEEGVR